MQVFSCHCLASVQWYGKHSKPLSMGSACLVNQLCLTRVPASAQYMSPGNVPGRITFYLSGLYGPTLVSCLRHWSRPRLCACILT